LGRIENARGIGRAVSVRPLPARSACAWHAAGRAGSVRSEVDFELVTAFRAVPLAITLTLGRRPLFLPGNANGQRRDGGDDESDQTRRYDATSASGAE
jgi:hypothetical protein